MSDNILTVQDIFKPLYDDSKGLFTYIKTQTGYSSLFSGLDNDFEYIFSHSATKQVSAVVYYLLNSDDELTEANMQKLAKLILDHYGKNWIAKYNVLTTSYDPIENYDRTENETNKFSRQVDNQLNGFNSTDPVDTTSTTESGSDTNNVRTVRVHGNIGVTTSQQMIESELELRKYDWLQEVFNDVDKLIALKVY